MSRTWIILLACLAIPIVPFVAIGELPGERWLSSQDESSLTFGLVGAGLLFADVFLPIPSSIVGTLLGARLGLPVGFIWVFLGLTAGHCAGFCVGRLAFRNAEAKLATAPTLIAVFLSRPVPVLAEAVAIAAGASAARFRPFLLALSGGNAIYAAALAGNGAALIPQGMIGPALVLPMALPALGWLIWRRRERAAEP